MPVFLAGLLMLLMALSALGRLSRANPKLAQRLSRSLASTLVLMTLGLLFRGRFSAAGLGAFTQSAKPFWRARPQKDDGRWSRARSATIAMRLDHDTGAIEGEVLAGPMAGRPLSSLTLNDGLSLLDACRRYDPDGARLLETYLDRRFPAWRDAEQREPDGAGRGNGSGGHWGPMTRQEAYQTLGLRDGAGGEEIIRAHRALMKKFHPDRGGSTAQAALVNQAKDILLTRHGTP